MCSAPPVPVSVSVPDAEAATSDGKQERRTMPPAQILRLAALAQDDTSDARKACRVFSLIADYELRIADSTGHPGRKGRLRRACRVPPCAGQGAEATKSAKAAQGWYRAPSGSASGELARSECAGRCQAPSKTHRSTKSTHLRRVPGTDMEIGTRGVAPSRSTQGGQKNRARRPG